ncbi:radical SAM/SPASM domain-containing protein [Bacteroidia bacterium]|nr:radical SAM/SPASM domain-containing protein [Bacteroidia bacterium]
MILILKPTLACNISCKYCYLSAESKTSNKFDVKFAKSVLQQVKDILAPNKKRRLKILWHGGEPLLWGIKNYTEIFAYIEKEFERYNYSISIQTNLSLINEDFIDLFLKYKVSVGCSLDGPKEIHDTQRVTRKGEGTFDLIMEKGELCREKGLKLGCIVVGTKKHIGKIPLLYKFMCDNNIGFKFNPIFNAGEAKKNIDNYGLTLDEYATMAIELFDLWFYDNKNKINNSVFADIASGLISKKTSHCLFDKNCQDNILAIAPNGDVVPCGRFCDDGLKQYAYGNLHTENLNSILKKIKISDIYNRYKCIEESSCSKCEFFAICNGGCLYDGFAKTGDFKSKTFLCSAYKKIYSHISNRLKEEKLL